MFKRALVSAGIMVTFVMVPAGASTAFADGPYSDNPSGYYSDGYVPPGGNYEISTPSGPFGSSIGVQFGQNAGQPSQTSFFDSCAVVTAPTFCAPFVGCVGGKLVGEYESQRIYTPGGSDACTLETRRHSDHDAQFRNSYYSTCMGPL